MEEQQPVPSRTYNPPGAVTTSSATTTRALVFASVTTTATGPSNNGSYAVRHPTAMSAGSYCQWTGGFGSAAECAATSPYGAEDDGARDSEGGEEPQAAPVGGRTEGTPTKFSFTAGDSPLMGTGSNSIEDGNSGVVLCGGTAEGPDDVPGDAVKVSPVTYDDSQDFFQPFESVASDGRPIVYNLYKTKMCKNWVATGNCPYAWKCQFAHGQAELRQRQRPASHADAYSMYAGYRIYTSMPTCSHFNQANMASPTSPMVLQHQVLPLDAASTPSDYLFEAYVPAGPEAGVVAFTGATGDLANTAMPETSRNNVVTYASEDSGSAVTSSTHQVGGGDVEVTTALYVPMSSSATKYGALHNDVPPPRAAIVSASCPGPYSSSARTGAITSSPPMNASLAPCRPIVHTHNPYPVLAKVTANSTDEEDADVPDNAEHTNSAVTRPNTHHRHDGSDLTQSILASSRTPSTGEAVEPKPSTGSSRGRGSYASVAAASVTAPQGLHSGSSGRSLKSTVSA